MQIIKACAFLAAVVLAPLYIQAQSSENPDSAVAQDVLLAPGYRMPKPVGWVNDYEHILTTYEQHTLDSISAAYQKQTGVQIAIVTIDTFMVTYDNFDAYTLTLANTWGVGEKGKDNGILIGFSSGRRRVRIQNGLGIEKLISNDETKVIVDTAMLPQFKKGLYYNGLLNGLLQLIQLLDERMK